MSQYPSSKSLKPAAHGEHFAKQKKLTVVVGFSSSHVLDSSWKYRNDGFLLKFVLCDYPSLRGSDD